MKQPQITAKQAGSWHLGHFALLLLAFPMGDAPSLVTWEQQEPARQQQVLRELSITISILERQDEPSKSAINPSALRHEPICVGADPSVQS